MKIPLTLVTPIAIVTSDKTKLITVDQIMSSPETSTTKRLYTPEERNVLSIDAIEEWRELQRKALYKERLKAIREGRSIDDSSYIDDFRSKNDTTLDEFLSSKGIESSHAGYGDLRDTLESSSIDSVHDDEWYSSPKTRGLGDSAESEREKIDLSMRNHLIENDREDTAEIDITPEKFNELARKKQMAHTTLIQTPMYDFQARKEARIDYDKAADDYDKALESMLARDTSGVTVVDDNSHENDINEIINRHLNTQNKSQHGILIEKGGKRAQLLEKYSTFSTKKKIGYGLGLGVAGAAAGFVAGAAGAGAAAVIAGMKIYGVSRSYFLGKANIYKEPGDTALDFTYDRTRAESASVQAVEYARRHDNLVIEQAETTKKRALGLGLGAAALTGAAGAIGAWAHSALDAAEPIGGNDGHWRAGYLEHIGDADVSGDVDTPSVDLPGGGSGGESDFNTPDSDADKLAKEAAEKAHALESYIDSHEDGFSVEKGEGWYHTFKEFGVTGSKQDDLLREIGPELERMGEAHRTEDGLWGINRPGELSDEASKLIVETADAHNWLGEQVSSSAESAPIALQEVKPGEGILQTLHDAGVEDPTLQDVDAVQDQLVQDGAAYQNGPGGYAGLNLPVDGMMDAKGVETVMDYADNKQLDNSVAENMVGAGEDVVDADTLPGLESAEHDVHSYLEWAEMQGDIHQMSDLLKEGSNESIQSLNANDDFQDTMKYIQADLKGLNYPGTDTPVLVQDYSVGGERWKFNVLPEGATHMPAKVINTLIAYEQRQFALAS